MKGIIFVQTIQCMVINGMIITWTNRYKLNILYSMELSLFGQKDIIKSVMLNGMIIILSKQIPIKYIAINVIILIW